MKRLWLAGVGAVVLATAALAAPAATATDAVPDKKESAAEALQPMTLTGTVEKAEKMKKDGTPMMTWYTLTGDDGASTHLPKGKVEAFVGKKVKITGTGSEVTKKGKTTRRLETIASIEEAGTGK